MIAEVAKGSGVGRFILCQHLLGTTVRGDEVYPGRALGAQPCLAVRPQQNCLRESAAQDGRRPVCTCVFRLGTVYGSPGRTRFDLVVNLLTAKAVIDHEITVMGGDQWRPFPARAVQCCPGGVHGARGCSRPGGQPGLQRRRDDQNYTISQVGEIIYRAVPTAKLIDLGSDTDRRNYRLSFSHIRRQLGFLPRYTVAQGVQQVLHAFAQGQVTDYRAASYSNVKFLNDGGKAQRVH